MLQSREIQERFSHVEQTIHQLAQACESTPALPMDLKDSIQQLEQKSQQAKAIIMQSDDESSVRQCVNDLEQLGDRSRDACQQAGTVDPDVADAVMQAHRELSELKHQLH
jgi:chromosome segregation ATPase